MSQLVLEIKNELVKERLLWLLQHFKKDELEIVNHQPTEHNQAWSDDYIEKNWKTIVSKSLANLPEGYEKSEAHYEARANYLMKKYK
ncbi:hypothetical protein JX580_00400 [Thiomicrospira microaerophila]|uniref:hypothetical protein n=1 Tax=Thiomicrospira microaerophila TaxID=406020 RepID=UPI00200BB22C|nr:hypothetical protein [Thiomicrospira microaerophila]UQB42410.1 hypothetical protein JX580_00400 [Thiomicrospira microaerophila]